MNLDDAYANVPYIPGGAGYPARWSEQAQAFRDVLAAERRAELGLSYGPSERQAFDLFHPEGAAKGLLVFVHGGYWLRFDRSFWSHLAAGALVRGWAVAMPSYDLCPEVRIADITAQIARAVTAAAARVDGPIALAGHSAGGHLVARMAVPGVLPDDVAARLSHVMPISPVSDLRPLLETSMNADF
ncbi:MAG: alpha/beta hydrolase, partial [Roseovarius sp.]|nr:alpha/beta hydrolase [Roseovarius sp.]